MGGKKKKKEENLKRAHFRPKESMGSTTTDFTEFCLKT